MPDNTLSATAAVVVALNVSYKDTIDEQTLVRIFKEQNANLLESWRYHLRAFFSELPVDYLVDFMKENHLTPEMLEQMHSQLPEVHQSKKFIELLHGKLEMALS